MNPVLPLLAPIALLLPGVAGVELAREIPPAAEPVSADAEAFEPQVQHQVSIEQRITIRVAPRAPIAPNTFDSLPANGVDDYLMAHQEFSPGLDVYGMTAYVHTVARHQEDQ